MSMNAMLDIDIQTPDLPGEMEHILGELKQLRESNALLVKRGTKQVSDVASTRKIGRGI
jgi:hypothetical protein